MSRTKTRRWRWLALALLALSASMALRLAIGALGARTAAGGAAASGSGETPEDFRFPTLDAGVWKLFRSGAPLAPPAPAGALSARFRLAGVSWTLSEDRRSGPEHRFAILDDLQTQQQFLVNEEDWLDQVRVVRIESESVVLSDENHEETIFLAAGTLTSGEKPAAGGPAAEAVKILESNRFGNRVGETRWEISRQAVLDYYQEMMDNPERLAALFMAMEADRDEAGKVAGYRVNMDVGEKEFYTQVGLLQGDVVRKVNSMRMTSQRRAEYFIGEFVQNRLGAVVIDVERNGEEKKLIYLIK